MALIGNGQRALDLQGWHILSHDSRPTILIVTKRNKDPKVLISKQFFISLSDWPTNYAKRYDESMQPSTKNSCAKLSSRPGEID